MVLQAIERARYLYEEELERIEMEAQKEIDRLAKEERDRVEREHHEKLRREREIEEEKEREKERLREVAAEAERKRKAEEAAAAAAAEVSSHLTSTSVSCIPAYNHSIKILFTLHCIRTLLDMHVFIYTQEENRRLLEEKKRLEASKPGVYQFKGPAATADREANKPRDRDPRDFRDRDRDDRGRDRDVFPGRNTAAASTASSSAL